LLASACGQSSPTAPPRNLAQPAQIPSPPQAAPAENAANAVNAASAAPSEPAADDPALAALAPAQRRAYRLGYRDCGQGRYVPADHLEAYRIGCAAAHDH
jgi:hypothetical protein